MQTQPVGRFCPVYSGSGTMGSADVGNVQVICHGSGTLDMSFGAGGVAETHPPSGYSYLQDGFPALQSDGKTVVAGSCFAPLGNGSSIASACVARFNADGSLDTSFGTAGIAGGTPARYTFSQARAISILSNGQLLMGGNLGDSNPNVYFAAMRYNTDGSLDPRFGSSGIAKLPAVAAGTQTYSSALAVQPDGRIVAAGPKDSAAQLCAVARFTAGGVLDTSFNGSGFQSLGSNVSCRDLSGVVIHPDGRITVGVTTWNDSDFLLAQLLADGSFDSHFGSGGVFTRNFAGNGNDLLCGLPLQPDGAILAAGRAHVPRDWLVG